MTARTLESIIRLSQAHAKLHLARMVELVDVDAALEIVDACFSSSPQDENQPAAGARRQRQQQEEEGPGPAAAGGDGDVEMEEGPSSSEQQ